VKNLGRRTTTLLVALLGLLLVSAPALAISIHFASFSGSILSNGNLSVNFKEAGLGSGVTITVELLGDANANYGCYNNGGHKPSAENKSSTGQTVLDSGSFGPATRAGNIDGSFPTAGHTISPPPPDPAFSCPPGQTLKIESISYTNLQLHDTTNNVFSSIFSVTKTFNPPQPI
jgi:hypothetical protein